MESDITYVPNVDYSKLPAHCRAGMQRYIENGTIPGDFLVAIICNNLVDAYGQADDINTERMRDYAVFLYNEAPRGSWGSVQIMKRWNEIGGLKGMTEKEKDKGG